MKVNAEDIRKIIGNVDKRYIAKLKDDTLFEDAGVDSLDTFNILLGIEEKYGVDIPDEDVNSLVSIDRIVNFLNQENG